MFLFPLLAACGPAPSDLHDAPADPFVEGAAPGPRPAGQEAAAPLAVRAEEPIVVTAYAELNGYPIPLVDGGTVWFREFEADWSAEVWLDFSNCDVRAEGYFVSWYGDERVYLQAIMQPCTYDRPRASGVVSLRDDDGLNPADGIPLLLTIEAADTSIDGVVSQPMAESWSVVTAIEP